MLELMLLTGLPHARGFSKELRGRLAATCRLRNHETMISRRPRDIHDLQRLRRFYEDRQANLRCILTIRDPRDALTSQHAHTFRKRRYHLEIARWVALTPLVQRYWNDPDVLIVRYEDLVRDVSNVQARIEAFLGEQMQRPFSEFHEQVPRKFRTLPLNGVRSIDSRGLARWRSSEHRQRIEEILQVVPDFPERLIELGYEKDGEWVDQWRLQLSRQRATLSERTAA
jgi:hypothetical protein